MDVNTRITEYNRRDVPGWGEKTGARVGNAIVQAGIRGTLGGTTEYTKVGHGTQVVSESGADGWRLSCSAFWIAAEDVKANNKGDDYTAGRTLTTQGLDCRAAPSADTTRVGWRFTRGIAPAFDSIAVLYDSLSADRSPLVAQSPPMALGHLDATGRTTEKYEVIFESMTRVRLSRENRHPVATILFGAATTLDLAPDVTPEERHFARLLATALATPTY